MAVGNRQITTAMAATMRVEYFMIEGGNGKFYSQTEEGECELDEGTITRKK